MEQIDHVLKFVNTVLLVAILVVSLLRHEEAANRPPSDTSGVKRQTAVLVLLVGMLTVGLVRLLRRWTS